MKEPWKKSCNGKVVITLNNAEKPVDGATAVTTGPTEVELPVDLAWASHRGGERRCSAPKAVILMGVVLVLGLTIVTLFKVQNLVYTTAYVNWRLQELESSINDNNDDVKLIKYKLDEFYLDEKNDEIASMRGARAEPLIGSVNSKNQDSEDLRLSESQNHKLTNSLNSEKKPSEGVGKDETKSDTKEQTDLNDVSNHANPADPEEWIKPLVETFDMEDQFIHNVLMKLIAPKNNIEVVELKEANSREDEKMRRPFPFESIFMKNLLPPIKNFKVFHFNEQQQPNSMEEEQSPRLVPPAPIGDIFKSLISPGNMKIIHQQQEDMPKVTIQSVKLRLVPIPEEVGKEMPQDRDQSPPIQVFRLNESPEPSQEVEAPKMSPFAGFHPFPIPIQEIMRSILPTIPGVPGVPDNIEIVPFNMDKNMADQQQDGDSQQEQQQQDRFDSLPIHLRDLVMKVLMPEQQPPEQQQESNEDNVEITKVPVRAIHPYPIPKALMKSMLPVSNYGGEPMHLINVAETHQQQQPQPQQQSEERQRSTKLNPVQEDWNMAPPAVQESTPQN